MAVLLKTSLELFTKRGELLFQVRDFRLKFSNLILEARDPLGAARAACRRSSNCRAGRRHFHVATEQVRVARFLRARLPREHRDERRLALHQPLQRGLHDAQVVEFVHAVGAAAQFAGCLRAAEQQLG